MCGSSLLSAHLSVDKAEINRCIMSSGLTLGIVLPLPTRAGEVRW